MFFAQLESLCEMRNTTPSTVARELGYSMGSVSQWKKGSEPKGSIVVRFADYFGVTTDYLLGKSDTPNPPKVELREGLGYAFLDGYRELDDEDISELNRMAERMLELKRLRDKS